MKPSHIHTHTLSYTMVIYIITVVHVEMIVDILLDKTMTVKLYWLKFGSP